MRWPWSGDDGGEEKKKKNQFFESPAKLTSEDWATALTDPATIGTSLVLTASTVAFLRFYKSYLRRIPSVNHIKPNYFRRRSLFGQVTSVGDADNFRLFHTPGGRIAGWGWMPWKKVPTKREALVNNTIHIRIAGVDAPELAHWGREAQPYSKEAFDWLTAYVHNRRVRAHIFRRDQYDRVVAQVTVRKWFRNRDVGLEMLKLGLATVYEAKTGSEFGQFEQQYRDAQKKAEEQKVGMWTRPNFFGRLRGESVKAAETPREYKQRHAAAEKQKKSA